MRKIAILRRKLYRVNNGIREYYFSKGPMKSTYYWYRPSKRYTNGIIEDIVKYYGKRLRHYLWKKK